MAIGTARAETEDNDIRIFKLHEHFNFSMQLLTCVQADARDALGRRE